MYKYLSFKDKKLSDFDLSSYPSGKGYKVDIAVSDWNEEITSRLLTAAVETLEKLGVQKEDIKTVHTPGAFELPFAARSLLQYSNPDAVICLGCVIKGETKHDEYISQAVAVGITQLSLSTHKPVIFGVLTVNDVDQARERSGGKHGNKGAEAAATAVKMIALQKSLAGPKGSIGYQ